MDIIFPKLFKWQEDVWNAMKDARNSGKTFVICSPRQRAKTSLTILLLIKFAIEKKCISAMIQPTMAQSRRVFKQILSLLEGSKLIKGANAQTLEMTFTNGSEIIFKSAEQKEALRGYTVSGLLCLDEMAFIDDEIYDIVLPWTNVHKAPLLVTSTPLFTDGKFYELFNDKNNVTFNWSDYDTSALLSKEKQEYYKKTMSPMKYKSEILGEFITDGSYVFNNVRNCILIILLIIILLPFQSTGHLVPIAILLL